MPRTDLNVFRYRLVTILLLCISFGYSFRPSHRVFSTSRNNLFRGIGPPSNPRGPATCLSAGDADNEGTKSDVYYDDSSDNPLMKKWNSLSAESRDDIKSTVISLGIAIFIRLFIFEPRFIPSLSMFPTFDIGDQLLVDKVSRISRQYQRRDVVVFNPSQTYVDLTGNTEALIKRVVAVEGDTVEVKGRKLYVNGIKQEEPFINEDPDYDLPATVVPQGMLLVLGDNRNHSFDSHLWGFLPERNVIGRAVLKYWPPWRAGFVEGSQ